MNKKKKQNIGSFLVLLGFIASFTFPFSAFILRNPTFVIVVHGVTGIILVLIGKAIFPTVSERQKWIEHCKKNKLSKEVREKGLSYM